MVEIKDTCAYVDSFIADLLNGNIEVIYLRAKNLVCFKKETGFLGTEKQKNKEPFPDALGKYLAVYQENKDDDPAIRLRLAEDCFCYIVWANTHQVIKRTGIANKIRELQKENAQLKEEKDKYQKEIARLTLLNEALHETMDNFGERIGSGNGEEGTEE